MKSIDRFKMIGKNTIVVLAIAVLFIAGSGAIKIGIADKDYFFIVAGAINIGYGIYNVAKAWKSLNNN